MTESDPHAEYSSTRENILEHLFLGELGRELWKRGNYELEILRAEVDAAGYDVVVTAGDITRYIQLKGKTIGGKATSWSISERLSRKQGGCVVIIYMDRETLETSHYSFFGGAPGEMLPDITGAEKTKHTKGNASGYKAERKHHTNLKESKCTVVDGIEELVEALFF